MRKVIFLLSALIFLIFPLKSESLWEKADRIIKQSVIIDAHEDVPTTLLKEDVSSRREKGHFDLPRAFLGGLTAPCFAIFTSNVYDNNHPAEFALRELAGVYEFAYKNRDRVLIAHSYLDILRAKQQGKMAIVITMENSSPIEDPAQLLLWKRLGLRMAILTHMKTNMYADSATDEEKWGGLSPRGKEMVRMMNRQGILVDVSHLSDRAAAQAIELTTLPPVASHSCVRNLNPIPRNLPDHLIKAIAAKGGVIGVNFFPVYLSREVYGKWQEVFSRFREILKKEGREKAREFLREKTRQLPRVGVAQVVEQIKYIAKLVGIEHVGLGSDFEGISITPEGLEDVSKFRNLVYEMLRQGFSEREIKMVLGGNFLRVFRKADEAYWQNFPDMAK